MKFSITTALAAAVATVSCFLSVFHSVIYDESDNLRISPAGLEAPGWSVVDVCE